MSDRWPGGVVSGTVNTPVTTPPYCSGVWTMEQAAYWIAQGQWPYGPSDSNFENVTLLLNGDGTNGRQNNTFLDSSTNNFTITRNGNTTQGSFSPYGTLWSNFQNDVASDYVSFATGSGSNFQFTGDFTIEGWVYYTSASSGDASLYVNSDGGNYLALNISMTAGVYNIYLNNTSPVAITHGITANTWTHVAMVRSGSTITLYTNGVSKGTISNSSTLGYASPAINRNGGGVSGVQRYTSNLRVVKGTAVYTTGFTPPVTPLTAISGTSVLTCQSNRFIDNSSNAYTVTPNGSPSVQRFSPFEPSAPYSTSVIGGSGYFDGSGDYLSVADNAAFDLGSSDFTIEGWVYLTSSGASQTFVAKGTGADNQASYHIVFNGTNWIYYLSGNGSTWSIANGVTMGAGVVNAWQYLALVRSGSTFTPYVNGIAGTTTTSSTALFDSNKILSIGADDPGNQRLTGYVSNLRILKGTAATITVPTAPLTAITNTSILTNFTNASIADLAMQNNLETLGNAQISTSVVKYGTGSISFDGNTSTYLRSSERLGYTFGTGDFTVEAWIYPQAATNRVIMANRVGTVGTANHWSFEFFNTANRLEWHTGLAIIASSNTNITLNAWSHVAVTRNSGTLRIFQNGQIVASVSDTSNYSEVNPLLVGYEPVFPSTNAPFLGYMDDIRITKGLARYTANFTPPTAALPTY